ncbi:hypothetical protein Trydic_g23957 [Trypoxylus dichotomus]
MRGGGNGGEMTDCTEVVGWYSLQPLVADNDDVDAARCLMLYRRDARCPITPQVRIANGEADIPSSSLDERC